MKNRILYFLLLTGTNILGSLNYVPLASVVQQYDWAKHPRSLVTYVQDPEGNKYVVKQYRYDKWQSLLATSMCELVALDLGHALGVPLNTVCLIPAGVPFIGKETASPASLHTVVPGIPFNEYLEQGIGIYVGLDLKQKERPYGLTRDLIYQMSRHKDFPAMVALDTFVSNGGRLTHNFFYDEATDMFWGIDMASSFCNDLCGPSIENINHMLGDRHIHFSETEAEALVCYYRAFEKLVNMYSPELLCRNLEAYALQAGFYSPSFFDKDVQKGCLELLAKRQRSIKTSGRNAPELVRVLKKLLNQHGLL